MNIPNILITCTNDNKTGGVLRWIPKEKRFEKVFNRQSMGILKYKNGYVLVSHSSLQENQIYEESVSHSIYCFNNNFEILSEITIPMEMSDLHDIVIHDHYLYVVDTWNNRVVKFFISKKELDYKFFPFFDMFLIPISEWKYNLSNEYDSCHVNSISVNKQRIFVSIFGEFSEYRGYKSRKESGKIIEITDNFRSYNDKGFQSNLSSYKTIIPNLEDPHSLYQYQDMLFFCESGKGRVWKDDSIFLDSLDGYVRGLVIYNNFLLIGKSTSRHSKFGANQSSVIIVNIENNNILQEINIPTKEIYDLILE